MAQDLFDRFGGLNRDWQRIVETEINESFDEQLAVYSEMLSQGREETRIDVADLRRMVEETVATDPHFWAWVQNEIAGLVNEHRGTAKKD